MGAFSEAWDVLKQDLTEEQMIEMLGGDQAIEAQYDEMLNETGPVTIAGMEYDVARALKAVDRIAYLVGLSDYQSSLFADLEYQHEMQGLTGTSDPFQEGVETNEM